MYGFGHIKFDWLYLGLCRSKIINNHKLNTNVNGHKPKKCLIFYFYFNCLQIYREYSQKRRWFNRKKVLKVVVQWLDNFFACTFFFRFLHDNFVLFKPFLLFVFTFLILMYYFFVCDTTWLRIVTFCLSMININNFILPLEILK